MVRRAESCEQNTHPSHHARMRILNKATEDSGFFEKYESDWFEAVY